VDHLGGQVAVGGDLVVPFEDGEDQHADADDGGGVGDMSDLLINTGGTSQPPASVVPGRYDNHEQIITALREGDQIRARDQMEAHIVGALALLRAEARTA
jgi:hypothetical protein